MLAKKTSKNQVTLPRKVVAEIPDTEYFDVSVQGGSVILRPVTVAPSGSRLANVRRKIRDLGLGPQDVQHAIEWARRGRSRRA